MDHPTTIRTLRGSTSRIDVGSSAVYRDGLPTSDHHAAASAERGLPGQDGAAPGRVGRQARRPRCRRARRTRLSRPRAAPGGGARPTPSSSTRTRTRPDGPAPSTDTSTRTRTRGHAARRSRVPRARRPPRRRRSPSIRRSNASAQPRRGFQDDTVGHARPAKARNPRAVRRWTPPAQLLEQRPGRALRAATCAISRICRTDSSTAASAPVEDVGQLRLVALHQAEPARLHLHPGGEQLLNRQVVQVAADPPALPRSGGASSSECRETGRRLQRDRRLAGASIRPWPGRTRRRPALPPCAAAGSPRPLPRTVIGAYSRPEPAQRWQQHPVGVRQRLDEHPHPPHRTDTARPSSGNVAERRVGVQAVRDLASHSPLTDGRTSRHV